VKLSGLPSVADGLVYTAFCSSTLGRLDCGSVRCEVSAVAAPGGGICWPTTGLAIVEIVTSKVIVRPVLVFTTPFVSEAGTACCAGTA